jgi:hypothetical protein
MDGEALGQDRLGEGTSRLAEKDRRHQAEHAHILALRLSPKYRCLFAQFTSFAKALP